MSDRGSLFSGNDIAVTNSLSFSAISTIVNLLVIPGTISLSVMLSFGEDTEDGEERR